MIWRRYVSDGRAAAVHSGQRCDVCCAEGKEGKKGNGGGGRRSGVRPVVSATWQPSSGVSYFGIEE